MLFSLVKISCFRAKAHLVFHGGWKRKWFLDLSRFPTPTEEEMLAVYKVAVATRTKKTSKLA